MASDREALRFMPSIAARALDRAMGQLLGIVTGVVADGELTDKEVLFLRTWLTEQAEVAAVWPGRAIAEAVSLALADGVISQEERAHLIEVLQQLVGVDFAETGAVSPEAPSVPVTDEITVDLVNAGVCHTGEFLFGTRAAVERATLKAGGMPLDNVTRRTDFLVIGTRVSPYWAQTTYGRKIERAVELREAGSGIEIISERRWLEVVAP